VLAAARPPDDAVSRGFDDEAPVLSGLRCKKTTLIRVS
jgi:hypothetical protein